MACEFCGLSPQQDYELHRELAALHPDRDWLQGAVVATEIGRHVLALKLATAAARWGDPSDPTPRAARLQSLDAMGQHERALDEAHDWARGGAPAVVWSIIATLELAANNPEEAARALWQGIERSPDDLSLFAEYAEVCAHGDQRARALSAARRVLPDPELRERGLAVIADVGERYFHEGRSADLLEALRSAGEHDVQHAGIAWLHARVALELKRSEDALRWLEIAVRLNPANAEAKEAFDGMKPKKGWFPW
jgi:tetratricopeptide (TPR) repeat protein